MVRLLWVRFYKIARRLVWRLFVYLTALYFTRRCKVSINLRMEFTVRIAMFVLMAMITIAFGWERA